MVTVIFPIQFDKLLNGQRTQSVVGNNLVEALSNLCDSRKDLRKVLFVDSGELSPFIAFTVRGDEKILTSSSAAAVPLKSGDVVEIVIAMAGG